MIGKYKLLGTEDMEWVCDFCGKKEISVCYTVEDTQTGMILRFGSSCIRKALKIGRSDLSKEIKIIKSSIQDKYRKLIFSFSGRLLDVTKECRAKYPKAGFLPKECVEYWRLSYLESSLRKRMYREMERFYIA